MKKLFLFSATLALVGCLNTQTRNPRHQPSNASSAAVVSSGCCAPATRSGTARSDSGQPDEEYFQENSFRWPDDWQQRHSQPPAPVPAPEPQPSEPPHGELY